MAVSSAPSCLVLAIFDLMASKSFALSPVIACRVTDRLEVLHTLSTFHELSLFGGSRHRKLTHKRYIVEAFRQLGGHEYKMSYGFIRGVQEILSCNAHSMLRRCWTFDCQLSIRPPKMSTSRRTQQQNPTTLQPVHKPTGIHSKQSSSSATCNASFPPNSRPRRRSH